jgi:hypothetical protein
LQNKKHPLADMYRKKAQGNKPNSPEHQGEFLEPYAIPSKRRKNPYDVEEPTVSNYPVHDSPEIDSPLSPVDYSMLDQSAPTPALNLPVKIQALPEPPKPVVLTSKIDSLSEETILSNKASEEKILEQFANYQRGTPSKVLYVKNLDKQAGIKDLVSLFIRFQEEGKDKISFKLMDGKMKGQAFVTFHDEPTATAALELVHGYIFNSKPIIIQYGKAK